MSQKNNPLLSSRRTFVKGMATVGACLDLVITPMRVNVTGKESIATTVNELLPDPLK